MTVCLCPICDAIFAPDEDDVLVIEGVPASTFELSEDTISLNIVECERCGAAQLVETPLSDDYVSVYRSIGSSVAHRENKKNQLSKFAKQYNLLENKRVVEVGCGNGQILEILREIGITAYGLEGGEENRRVCSDLGYDVLPLDTVEHPSVYNLFDAFMTFHFIEHLPNPVDFVNKLYDLLVPGGIGLIEVPNYDHIWYHNIWLEFTRDHRLYFRKRTMSYLVLSCGFEILFMEENEEGLCLTIAVRKPYTQDMFAGMKTKMARVKKQFKELIDTMDGSFAVYGAGHYTQLLLNMAHKEYGITPTHIFDSNPLKCGGTICRVIVEHRDYVKDMDDCDNILVSCGLYNDEVESMLEDMNLGKNIYVWR